MLLETSWPNQRKGGRTQHGKTLYTRKRCNLEGHNLERHNLEDTLPGIRLNLKEDLNLEDIQPGRELTCKGHNLEKISVML